MVSQLFHPGSLYVIVLLHNYNILVPKGVGRHRQGGHAPWPENSFILTVEATKNRGLAPLKIEKWLGSSPLDIQKPSPGKIPAYALAGAASVIN